MKKIGIIHTTPATIASLNQLVKEKMPDTEVINFLDDSILGDMRTRHEVGFVRKRWISYAKTLEQLGVCAVLSACSTVGEFAEEADKLLRIPVFRIDEAMCERAVEMGNTVSVLATLQSTLQPTVRLVEKKADLAGKRILVNTVLVEGAYEALMAGKKDVHDGKIAAAVKECLKTSDAVVLAQASMASAVEEGCSGFEKILTSPVPGIERLKEELEK